MNSVLNSCSRAIRYSLCGKWRNFCTVIDLRKDAFYNVIEKSIIREINFTFSQSSISENRISKVIEKVNKEKNSLTLEFIKKVTYVIMNESTKRKLVLNIDHIHQMLDMYLLFDVDFDPKDFLLFITVNNISANNLTLEYFLRRYCRLGDIDSATKISKKMLSLRGYLNSTKCSWFIGCAIRANNREEIDKFYQIITNNKLPMTHLAYAFIAEAYANQKDLQNCIRTYKDCEAHLGHAEELSNIKFNSYYELAKIGASTEILLQMIKYLQENVNERHIFYCLLRLSRHKLFKASEVLIDNIETKISQENYINFIRQLALHRAPLEIRKKISTRVDDKSCNVYLLRQSHPFEYAFQMAKEQINLGDIDHARLVIIELMHNTRQLENPVPKLKLILEFCQLHLSNVDFNKFLVSDGIEFILSIHKDMPQEKIISIYSNILPHFENIFIYAYIYYELCFGSLEEAQKLVEMYPRVLESKFKVDYDRYCYSFAQYKTMEDLFCRLLFMSSILDSENFQKFIIVLICKCSVLYTVDNLFSLLKFLNDSLSLHLTISDFTKLKLDKEIVQRMIELLGNFEKYHLKKAAV